MNKIKRVWLNRAEGYVDECGAVVFHAEDVVPETDDRHFQDAVSKKVGLDEIKDAVEKQLVQWGLSAPKDGGYDKTDFCVEWEGDDISYKGRFDLQYGGTDAREPFWQSVKSRIEFYACERRPSHFDDVSWDKHCEMAEEEGWKADCAGMLAECVM